MNVIFVNQSNSSNVRVCGDCEELGMWKPEHSAGQVALRISEGEFLFLDLSVFAVNFLLNFMFLHYLHYLHCLCTNVPTGYRISAICLDYYRNHSHFIWLKNKSGYLLGSHDKLHSWLGFSTFQVC